MNGIEQNYYLFGKFSEYLGCEDITQFIDEICNDQNIIPAFEEKVKNVDQFKTKKFNNIFDFRFFRLLMYVITRVRKPTVFIETGVMHGLTSSFILEAIKKNQRGKLISIDYPSYFDLGPSNKDGYLDTLPPNKEPGWIISEENLKQWDLRIGKSIDVLPKLEMPDLPIDIFLHDSEHTYETMTFEMEFAWKNMSPNGILIVDNIDNNDSFYDFCKNKQRTPLLLSTPDNSHTFKVRFGLLTK
jgi:predicted O-methyltransferase YrrM